MKTVSIVVPVFNEELALGEFYEEICKVRAQLDGYHLCIIFIDDGSADESLELIKKFANEDADVFYLALSRNFGKEKALAAGLDHGFGDALIPMDVDLQDPPSMIPIMIEKWSQGYDVILPVRVKRKSDGIFKKISASMFYALLNRISDVPIPKQVGDFRLLDRRVVEAIKTMRESERYTKGIFAWAGFATIEIPFERAQRVAGKTKFSVRRLVNLALDGVLSFSSSPLRLITIAGLSSSFLAIGYATYIYLRTVFYGNPVPGYASLMTINLVVSSILLFSLGIIGEYLGKIYSEVKNRPIYVVSESNI